LDVNDTLDNFLLFDTAEASSPGKSIFLLGLGSLSGNTNGRVEELSSCMTVYMVMLIDLGIFLGRYFWCMSAGRIGQSRNILAFLAWVFVTGHGGRWC